MEAPAALGRCSRLVSRLAVPAGLLCALLALAFLAVAPRAPAQAPPSSCADADLPPAPGNLQRVEAAIACVMNAERGRAGLPGLRVDYRLEYSAAEHTADMVRNHYFAHQGSGGLQLADRIAASRYFEGVYVALYSENLGVGPRQSATAAGIVGALMDSTSHRENILHPLLVDIGIGAALAAPDPAFYPDTNSAVYTMDFGRRFLHPPVPTAACRRKAAARRPARTSSATQPRGFCPKRKKKKRRRAAKRQTRLGSR